jgi:release factor glutamine methyltransferase
MTPRPTSITAASALKYGIAALETRPDIAAWSVEDATMLLAHVLNLTGEQLESSYDNALTSDEEGRFNLLIQKRLAAVPIQYLLGTQRFYGRTFVVTRDVFIPKPATELIIDEVKKLYDPNSRPSIVDVGTGSGAIAITLALELPLASILATDISAAALEVAKTNATRLGVLHRLRFLESDLLEKIDERFDCIVCNPPSFPSRHRASLHSQIRDFEPPASLFGESEDGYGIYRRLIPQAWALLHNGGWLVLAGGQPVVNPLLSSWSEVSTVFSPGQCENLDG